jgi:(2Fe-2S) ferredoxin
MFDFINTDIILNTLIREENKLLEIATKILEELKKYNKKQEKTPLSDRPKSLKKGKKEEDIKDNSTTNEDNNFKIISEDFNYYETIGNKKLYIEDNKQIIKSRIIQLLLEQKYSIIYTDILTEKVVDSMIQNNLIPELKNNEVEILVESKNLFEKLFNKVKEMLNINLGEMTKDGKFALVETRCIGACGLAPVFKINDEVYGKATPEMIEKILKEYIESR